MAFFRQSFLYFFFVSFFARIHAAALIQGSFVRMASMTSCMSHHSVQFRASFASVFHVAHCTKRIVLTFKNESFVFICIRRHQQFCIVLDVVDNPALLQYLCLVVFLCFFAFPTFRKVGNRSTDDCISAIVSGNSTSLLGATSEPQGQGPFPIQCLDSASASNSWPSKG